MSSSEIVNTELPEIPSVPDPPCDPICYEPEFSEVLSKSPDTPVYLGNAPDVHTYLEGRFMAFLKNSKVAFTETKTSEVLLAIWDLGFRVAQQFQDTKVKAVEAVAQANFAYYQGQAQWYNGTYQQAAAVKMYADADLSEAQTTRVGYEVAHLLPSQVEVNKGQVQVLGAKYNQAKSSYSDVDDNNQPYSGVIGADKQFTLQQVSKLGADSYQGIFAEMNKTLITRITNGEPDVDLTTATMHNLDMAAAKKALLEYIADKIS